MTEIMNYTAAPFLWVLICLAFVGASSGSEILTFNWTVAYRNWSPDCANVVAGTKVITINGSFPGPTIRAHVGDAIVVNLTNNLQTGEGVVIHWHGIQQRGTPWYDGTASISQCPIQAGKSFVYRYTVDKAGTYFYHGHCGMQRSAGLYGSLIVDLAEGETEPFGYDDELDLLLSDWWHKSYKQLEQDLSSRNFVWIGEPQIKTRKYVEPFEVNDMDIYSGESYSVLLTTNQNPHQNYWISISLRGRKPNTIQSLTLLNYLPTPSSHLPTSEPPVTPLWNNEQAFSNNIFAKTDSQLKPPHSKPNRRIVLLNTQNKVDGYIKWAINNVSLALPEKTSILKSITEGLDDVSPPDILKVDYDLKKPAPNPNARIGSGVYKINKGDIVDVILQNANALSANVSEIHPWHLHGHDFWVLGYGEGTFTDENAANFNTKNPPLRNTAVLYPYGWTALRFKADNPGVWAFHCHIEPDFHMGMGVVFSEAVDNIGTIPPEALTCEITEMIVANKNGACCQHLSISTFFSLFSTLAFTFIVTFCGTLY